jgi:8-oxo-dGTP diphosphatase
LSIARPTAFVYDTVSEGGRIPIATDLLREKSGLASMSAPLSSPSRRGVVAVVSHRGRLLVIRRSRNVVAPGAICFPGGGIESGESEDEALVREIHEELGAAIEPVRRLWRSITAWNVDLTWWMAHLDPATPLLPNPAEVESVHWLTPDELLELPELLTSNREFLHALRRGEIVLKNG